MDPSLISGGHKSRRKATSWILLGFKSEFKIDFAVIARYPALFGADSHDEQIARNPVVPRNRLLNDLDPRYA